jgi:hypothetical protein
MALQPGGTMDYPQDADGDALRRVARDGSDMSRAMDIDFAVAVPNEESGLAIAEIVRARGYRPDVSRDDESGDWTCYCTRSMVPTYDAIIAVQNELDALVKPLGGYSDGWGTFGNAG